MTNWPTKKKSRSDFRHLCLIFRCLFLVQSPGTFYLENTPSQVSTGCSATRKTHEWRKKFYDQVTGLCVKGEVFIAIELNRELSVRRPNFLIVIKVVYFVKPSHSSHRTKFPRKIISQSMISSWARLNESTWSQLGKSTWDVHPWLSVISPIFSTNNTLKHDRWLSVKYLAERDKFEKYGQNNHLADANTKWMAS